MVKVVGPAPPPEEKPYLKLIEVTFPEEINLGEERTWSVKVQNVGAAGMCAVYFSVKSRPSGGKCYLTPVGGTTMEVPDYPVVAACPSKELAKGETTYFSGSVKFDTAGGWTIVVGSGHIEGGRLVSDEERILDG